LSYNVGDTVFAMGSEPGEHYIAKVVAVKLPEVKLQWFYKPEDVTGGRQKWHSRKELFESKTCDWNPIACLMGACNVHTLDKFEELQEICDMDYFTRFRYKPETGSFIPDAVPVYCICETPYNPDKDMVECSECNDWFHHECVNYCPALSGPPSKEFCCPDCTSNKFRMA
jgi:hypothetical protein